MKSALLSFTTAVLFTLLHSAPAHAQATRTWVSGVGDDVNPCSRTAPCKTFAGAISKTITNGEINCLDPGPYGVVTITKSITIDCHEIYASILASGTNGIIINIAPGNPNDPLRSVRLRNININGSGTFGTVGTRTGLNGIRILQAQIVYLEDMMITDFSQRGISDERTVDGRLNVTNTMLRDNGGAGIAVSPSSAARIDVAMDRVTAIGNGSGMQFNNGPRVMINNSTSSNNSNSGVESTSSVVGSTTVNINRSMVSNNGGVALLTTGTSQLRFSDTDIAFNATGFSGATLTFGTSRITGNLVIGTVPTHMGGSFDGGQI